MSTFSRIVPLISLLLAGCGGASSLTTQSETVVFENVTGEMRAACLGMTDAIIAGLITAAEATLELGFTKAEALNDGFAACARGCENAAECTVVCASCAAAVVDEVWPSSVVQAEDDGPDAPASMCNVTYYNDDVEYGFDLPSTAKLQYSNVAPHSLFDSYWLAVVASGTEIAVTTGVWDSEQSLAGYVATNNALTEAAGGVIDIATAITLPNGRAAILTVSTRPAMASFIYDVATEKDGRIYDVWATAFLQDFTEELDILMSSVVLSLCVD